MHITHTMTASHSPDTGLQTSPPSSTQQHAGAERNRAASPNGHALSPLRAGPAGALGRAGKLSATIDEHLSETLANIGRQLHEVAIGLAPSSLRDTLLQMSSKMAELGGPTEHTPQTPPKPGSASSADIGDLSPTPGPVEASGTAALEDAATQLRYAGALNPVCRDRLLVLAYVLEQLALLHKDAVGRPVGSDCKAQEERLLQRAGQILADLSAGMSRRAQQRSAELQTWQQLHTTCRT